MSDAPESGPTPDGEPTGEPTAASSADGPVAGTALESPPEDADTTAAPADAADAPGADEPGWGDDEWDDEDPLEALPTESSPLRTTLIVLGSIAGVVVLALLAVVVWRWALDLSAGSTMERYLHGGGATWTGDGFHARYPTSPTRTVGRANGSRRVTVASGPTAGFTFTITTTGLAQQTAADPITALNTIAGTLAAQAGGGIVSQIPPTEFGLFTFKDLTYVAKGVYYRTRLGINIDQLYIVQTASRSRDRAPWKELTGSFYLTAVR